MKKEIEKILDELVGKRGVEVEIKDWVSTGNIALDWAISDKLIGGGLPLGRVIELFGDPSTGKSLLILHIIAEAQKKGYIAILDDSEASYNRWFAEKIGVNTKELYILDSITVEEHAEAVQKIIHSIREKDTKTPIIVALDSLAILSTKHERETGFEKPDLTKAKMVRQAMRLLGADFLKNDVLYVVSNHVISNIGVMYGAKKTTPGGSGVPFQSSVRVNLSVGSYIEGEKGAKGVFVRAKVVKNKIAPPLKEVELKVDFEKGVDKYSGLLDVLVSLGKINKNKGWYEYGGKSYREKEITEKLPEILEKVAKNEE